MGVRIPWDRLREVGIVPPREQKSPTVIPAKKVAPTPPRAKLAAAVASTFGK